MTLDEKVVVVQERRQGDRRQKNSFIMYFDWYEHFELLDDAELGILIRSIYNHVLRKENMVDLSEKLTMAFSFIKKQLDKDLEKYANICEKREQWGKLGGRPKKA